MWSWRAAVMSCVRPGRAADIQIRWPLCSPAARLSGAALGEDESAVDQDHLPTGQCIGGKYFVEAILHATMVGTN
jgi:hypothetical protein